MSVSAMVGFTKFGEEIHLKEAEKVVLDTIKKLELEVLTGWYGESSLSFEENYLLAVSQPPGNYLNLVLEGVGVAPCQPSEVKISWQDKGELIKNNLDTVLSTRRVLEDESECINFQESNDRQWIYQLRDERGGRYYSSVIRLIHFNTNQNPNNITIQNNDYLLKITSPYAKKALYNNGNPVYGAQSITLLHPENPEQEVFLQE